jgi:hypothetical protein
MWFDGDYIEVQEGLGGGLDRWGKKAPGRRRESQKQKQREREGESTEFSKFFWWPRPLKYFNCLLIANSGFDRMMATMAAHHFQ